MAKGRSGATGGSGTGGGVTRPTGQAFKPKGSGTGQVKPTAAKSSSSGSKVVGTKKSPVGRSGYGVTK